MADGKRESYTDSLFREIRAYLHSMASCASSPTECDAFYKASRLLGRNQGMLVSRAMNQMEWRDALAKSDSKEATDGTGT